MSENWKGGLGTVVTENTDGKRHPKTIQKFIRDKGGLHPTQKPVALMEYIIKSYTDEGDLVLDNTCGSGSTLVAAKNLKRKCYGIELEEKYCEIAKKRIEDVLIDT